MEKLAGLKHTKKIYESRIREYKQVISTLSDEKTKEIFKDYIKENEKSIEKINIKIKQLEN